jgi:hypothetical protein
VAQCNYEVALHDMSDDCLTPNASVSETIFIFGKRIRSGFSFAKADGSEAILE